MDEHVSLADIQRMARSLGVQVIERHQTFDLVTRQGTLQATFRHEPAGLRAAVDRLQQQIERRQEQQKGKQTAF